MTTGLETWNQNLLDVGPLYPMVGSEIVLLLVGLAIWIIWHIVQFRAENRTYGEESAALSDKAKLERTMRSSTSQTILEESREHKRDG